MVTEGERSLEFVHVILDFSECEERLKDDHSALLREVAIGAQNGQQQHRQLQSHILVSCIGRHVEKNEITAGIEELLGDGAVSKASTLLIKNSQNEVNAMIDGKIMVDEADVSELSIYASWPAVKCTFICKQVYNLNAYSITIKSTNEVLPINPGDLYAINAMLVQQIQECPSSDGKEVASLQSKLLHSTVIHHGFTTRSGGVSCYRTMKSLNMVNSTTKRDSSLFVDENRRRLAMAHSFDPAEFEMAKCVHGADVWVVGKPKLESYDAIVTDKQGVTIAAPGADCTTVLFYDPVKKVVGAAHSGWRGTLANISGNVLKTMETEYGSHPRDILVALGPSLGPCCFEVAEALASTFAEEFSADVVVRREGLPRPFVDLWKSITLHLLAAGIERDHIDNGGSLVDGIHTTETICEKVTQCTKCPENKDKFFSYRSDGKLFGNQCAFIGISEATGAGEL